MRGRGNERSGSVPGSSPNCISSSASSSSTSFRGSDVPSRPSEVGIGSWSCSRVLRTAATVCASASATCLKLDRSWSTDPPPRGLVGVAWSNEVSTER